jgi:murein DD-endopeptidase MepM/ murein hydrolase activator NlpD
MILYGPGAAMTKRFERTALILLAGTALGACASPDFSISRPVVQASPAAAPAEPPREVATAGDAAPQASAPVARRELALLPIADRQPVPETEAVPALTFTGTAVDAAARAKSRSPKPETADDEAASYKVRRGDTLETIAAKLGTDIPTLAKVNNLRKPYRLMPGQVLQGPQAAGSKATAGKTSAKSSRSAPTTYVVKSGDTLFSIAQRFGTTVEALKAENGIGRSSSIARGRKLSLPGAGGPARSESAEDEAPPPTSRSKSRREPPPPPAYEDTGGSRAAAGRVITIETAGKAYRVKRGDTLEKVARRLGAETDDLARINKLKRPYRLRAGQTVRGPGGSAKAYVVARGDTLAEIARRFGVSVDKLRTTNGLRRGAAVTPGRRLRLPAGYRDHGSFRESEPQESPPSSFRNPPPVGQTLPPPRSQQPSEVLPRAPQPYLPPFQPARPRTGAPEGGLNGAPVASPPVSDAQIMQMGRGLFQWPIRGAMISGFGDKGTSQRNDGVNIRANAGDAVRAAASGDVVYAGDQVPGFGNLVLIKHADGWVTAYGHLGKVDVRMQQKVTQGQQIGEAGSTGGVSEPQLHFEVRYAPNPQERARPVDPTLVLPK